MDMHQTPSTHTTKSLGLTAPYTEVDLISAYSRNLEVNLKPVFSASFIYASRAQYGVAWLSREPIQNFLDHNVDSPGTLNGVQFGREELADGSVRFTIEANGIFEDATGLITPFSDKPAGQETAGGNGVGLKQTALLLCRDYGVERFEVRGSKWNVSYRMIKAGDVNEFLDSIQDLPQEARMQTDWLCAELREEPFSERISYTIETKDSGLIDAFSTMSELGVSDSNPHLTGMHVSTEMGMIKWLFPDGEGNVPAGKLFMNGQICRYVDETASKQSGFWGGLFGVTVALSNLSPTESFMSIDRPALDSHKLKQASSRFVSSLDQEQLIHLLKTSEPLWSHTQQERSPQYSLAAHELIAAILDELKYKYRYRKEEFQNDFPDRRYALSSIFDPTPHQKRMAQEEGYTIIPEYFSGLGIQHLAALFPEEEELRREFFAANLPEDRRNRARSSGVELGYTSYSQSPFQMGNLVANGAQFQNLIRGYTFSSDGKQLVLHLNRSFTEELHSHPLITAPSDEHEGLRNLRGLVQYLLRGGTASTAQIKDGSITVDFDISWDPIIAKSLLAAKITPHYGEAEEGRVVLDLNADSPEAIEFIKGLQKESPAFLQKRSEWLERFIDMVDRRPRWLVPATALVAMGGGLFMPPVRQGLAEVAYAFSQAGSSISAMLAGPPPIPETGAAELNRWLAQGNTATPRDIAIDGKRSLADILRSSDTSNVESTSKLHQHDEDDHESYSSLENFKIVTPTEVESAKVRMLVTYFEAATGHTVENHIAVFEGKGALGVNFGQQYIGLHRGILKTTFSEAFSTFVHEVAHNRGRGHDMEWSKTMEALFQAIDEKQNLIALKLMHNKPLTEAESYIAGINNRWDAW